MAPTGKGQAECLSRISAKTGCGILFDVSNAQVAELNGGDRWADWQELAHGATHFHVAGFAPSARFGGFHDSHDRPPSEESMDLASAAILHSHVAQPPTVTIEYDHDIDVDLWSAALAGVRDRSGDFR